ncbi:MAG: hypothetical protein A2Z99_16295 [Treponema sp. GWB1_62_6]|nr:MAG: hypothetical protein A2Z99_16295 [Treponema sp. GWB1_62_6]OHE69940.1 MAG: hypothetical protein A2001_10835 [Treponema sp. GWC1_61_84]HCM26903.1 hypothetical protein [Treponema sp.]
MPGVGKKTILIVEDQDLIAEVEKKSLENYGYTVITANTGERALAILNEGPSIDLILMDITLGDGPDGPEIAEMILKVHDIPLIFLSSHTNPEVVERTESITSYGYVVKKSGITVLDASMKMAFKLFEANRKTREAKDKLEATLNALPDLLLEVGSDGGIFDCHSPRTAGSFQADTDLIGKNIAEIHTPDVTSAIFDAMREAEGKGFSVGSQFESAVPSGRRWFAISVSRKPDVSRIPHFIILERDITEGKRSEAALEAAFKENRALLMELQHRVKNSFNMIKAMVELAAGAQASAEAKAALLEIDVRITCISELYSLLYSSGTFTEVRLDEYCLRIAPPLAGLAGNISIVTDMDAMVIPAKMAAPIGLIVTELITNAVKYAYQDNRKGTITVALKKRGGGAVLRVHDDGIGLPDGFDLSSDVGVGLTLVQGLAEQIGAAFRMESDEKGTSCILEFR